MVTTIKLGFVNIDVMLVNTTNSRYTKEGLHRFSKCCKSKVKNKMVCDECGNEVLNCDVLKGFDKDNILTESQQEKLKTFLENGVIEVISIHDITETTTYDLIPYIQKSQIVFPSISKGYKKSNVRTFYSFVSALKNLNKYMVCKLVNRGLEHLVVILPYKDNLLMLFIPFSHYYNSSEVERIKEGVKNTIRIDNITELNKFEEQAKDFISKFDSEILVEEIKEDKLEMLEQFKNMDKTIEISVCEVKEENPFQEKVALSGRVRNNLKSV